MFDGNRGDGMFQASYDRWKVGSLDDANEEIIYVTGHSSAFIVYFVKGGWLKWNYDASKVVGAHKIEARAQVLLNKGKSWIKDKADFAEYRNAIAASMVHGLSHLEEREVADGVFDAAKELLAVHAKSVYQGYFVVTAILSTVFTAGPLSLVLALNWHQIEQIYMHVLLGAIAGTFGAFLSLLIRFRRAEPELETYASRRYVILESLIRIVIGVIFGALLVLLQEGGLLLTVAKNNLCLTVCLAFVAGFSERMIPAVLAEIERR